MNALRYRLLDAALQRGLLPDAVLAPRGFAACELQPHSHHQQHERIGGLADLLHAQLHAVTDPDEALFVDL